MQKTSLINDNTALAYNEPSVAGRCGNRITNVELKTKVEYGK